MTSATTVDPTVGSAIDSSRVTVEQDAIDDLRGRLRRTRWPAEETVDDWSQGVPLEKMRRWCERWADGYDWRATEARLNRFAQFTTRIDDTEIHFLQVRSPRPEATPLLLTHGWPSSILEFLDLIPLLTDPEDPEDDAFHVVCPALPGHGLAPAADTSGWSVQRIAEAWAALMARLGYDRYLAHGGDWGSWVAAALGAVDPEHVIGIHLTMPLARPPEKQIPFDDLDERDKAAMAKMQGFGKNRSGYAAIQSSRPQALGYGLADSPAGQLAWIADRFWEWTERGDDFTEDVATDRLLDIASMYWFGNSGAASARLFWESFDKEPMHPTAVPTGCSVCPADAWLPRAWARERFTDLRYWRDLPRGGHFPALEQPTTLAAEIRAFHRTTRPTDNTSTPHSTTQES